MIKIMHIIARLNIGGPAIYVIDLSSMLDQKLFKSFLVKGKEAETEGNMLYLANEKGIEPIIVPELGREIFLKDDIKAFFKLYSLMKKIRPDIVHTHTAKAGTLGRIAARLSGVPIIIHTFHGHIFKGYFNKFITIFFIYIERFLAKISTRIIALTESQRRDFINLNIGNKKKVIKVNLGLDLKRFMDLKGFKGKLRNELGISKNCPIIGIIARLVPIKSHVTFIRAVSYLRDWGVEGRYLIIGDGELRSELKAMVNDLRLDSVVHFLGFRKDLEVIYADMDILALTSLNEGSPIAIIEAMASGIPVVATEVGGVPDLVKNRKTGLLVSSSNSEVFAKALCELIENSELRANLGLNGRQFIYPEYDINTLKKNIEELYLTLINEKHAKRK